MEYNGKQIDDRYGILSPFFEWADGEIKKCEYPTKDTYSRGHYRGVSEALENAKTKLLEIVLQAERDADGNMAAAQEAR